MKEYEYEEENLDDFMVSAASILSEDNNPEKNSIIESLKQHLSTIFHIQNEMENFFKTLNGVIFTSKSKNDPQKIDNKLPFLLYPIIFSFNPRTTSYFLDFFLTTLQQSIFEDNRQDFTFLSEVFADVVKALFSDEKNNKNLIKKNYVLEPNKRKNIYDKFLNFCKTNIKTNKKLEQSFGCLLLTEFIEKCPLVKEEKNLESLFKMLSDYLDDRWFECKLDLLNCTISLIFSAESKFKPYTNVCLFRILDYLTDIDWMKRKLAINIVYTLVFYCKDEVMAVKENIYEFLNSLKEDSNEEVREVCMHILKFLGEDGDGEAIDPTELKREINKPNNVYNKYNNKNINQRNRNKSPGENGDSLTIKSAKSNKSFNNTKNNQNDNNLRKKLQKEQENLEKMERDFTEKKKNYNNNNNYNNNSNKSKNSNMNNNSANNTINNDSRPQQNINKVKQFENSSHEKLTSTIDSIFEQLRKIQEDQAEFKQMLINLKQTAGNNYLNLNERLRSLEKSFKTNRGLSYTYNDTYYDDSHELRSRDKKTGRINLYSRSDDKMKIEELKNRFNEGEYNEALISTNNNDRYLLKLIPLITKKIVPKIQIAILEDVISRLNKRLTILCMEGDRDSIHDILMFYIQLLTSKMKFKLVTQLNINNALNFLKVNGSNILTEDDINNIEAILSSLNI